MGYPVAYRVISATNAARTGRAALASGFVQLLASPAPKLPIDPGRTAKILAFPRLARYGTRKAITKLAVRLLLTKAIGPIGLILDLWELYQATQPDVAAHYDYTGWTQVQNCGGVDTFQYANHSAGCGTKFFVGSTEGDTLVTPNNPSPGNTRYSQQWLRSRTISGTTHFGPSGSIWAKVQPAADPAPDPFVPAADGQPALIAAPQVWSPPLGNLPQSVKDALAEWPQSYISEEPFTAPQEIPGRPIVYPNYRYEWEAPLEPIPGNSVVPGVRPRSPQEPATYTPAPPPRGTKEVKLRARAGYAAVLGLIGTATETLDFVDAMYKALPEKYKIKGRSRFASRARRVYEAALNGDLQIARSFEELFWANVEDVLFGRLGRLQSKSVQRLAEQGFWSGPFGTTVGGANRQNVTGAPEIRSPSPVDQLRELLSPYYEGYVPGERPKAKRVRVDSSAKEMAEQTTKQETRMAARTTRPASQRPKAKTIA